MHKIVFCKLFFASTRFLIAKYLYLQESARNYMTIVIRAQGLCPNWNVEILAGPGAMRSETDCRL